MRAPRTRAMAMVSMEGGQLSIRCHSRKNGVGGNIYLKIALLLGWVDREVEILVDVAVSGTHFAPEGSRCVADRAPFVDLQEPLYEFPFRVALSHAIRARPVLHGASSAVFALLRTTHE